MVSVLEEAVLTDYRKRLATTKEDEFLVIYEEFIRWLANLGESCIEEFEQQDYLTQHREFFTACQRRYLAVKERQEMNLLLEKTKTAKGSIGDCLMSAFGKNAYERVQDLSQMIDLAHCQRCVMVGCGTLPATLFYLYDRYPILDYIGIDIDSTAITAAKEAMYSLGIKEICLVQADGCEFDYAEAGLVYIANQVCPKNSVLERIAATANKTVQVVMRDPTRRGKLLADCGYDALPYQYSLVQKGKESQHFLSLDLLLRLQPKYDR